MAGTQANIRTFIAPLKGLGRSAPALLEDLTLHDPRALHSEGRNLLRDTPLHFIETPVLGDSLPENSCQHVFCLQPQQSRLPVLDENPGSDTIWIVAACCQRCRIHLNLKVDFTIRYDQPPCPNTDYALHHLQHSEWREELERTEWLRDNPGKQVEVYTYECSSPTCSATVTARLTPPVLSDAAVYSLTDKNLLSARSKSAFKAKEGNTEGMKYPLPIDVLTDLRAYVRNSWKQDAKFKSINLSNRRFIVRFGPDGSACRNVLESLGFKLQPGECWLVPEPNTNDAVPYQDITNILLDNVENELNILIHSSPVEEKQQAQDNTVLTLANRELSRALGCQDYDKNPSSRTKKPDPTMRRPAYSILGVPEDVSDSLLFFFYERQMQFSDYKTAPYLLQSLKYIGNERNSETLQTELMLEQSRGKFDIDGIREAYEYFNLSNFDARFDDDYIIGIFTSRLEDAPAHGQEMRHFLRIIGIERNSRKIIDTAENNVNTYEQALQFLGADASVSDDHIQALFAVKSTENKSYEELSIKAVRIIAQHRNSVLLNKWIDSGFAAETRMDAAEGYQALGIDNRTVEDDLIITQYDVIVQDNPTSLEYYNKALAAIAQERDSNALREHLQGVAPQSIQGTTEEPVGLENIGNTCYLNSLLQFLFTIVELRLIVLDFEQYRMEVVDTNMAQKQVGHRKVARREVETAQKFVASLATLFRGMIETPQTSIRPQQELARLTLETDSAKEKIRRRSTMLSDRPILGHIDNKPVLGPLQVPDQQINGVMNENAIQSPTDLEPPATLSETNGNTMIQNGLLSQGDQGDTDMIHVSDNSSEATLISRPTSEGSPAVEIPTVEEQQAILDNKENLSPTKADSPPRRVSFEEQVEPLRPASPSKMNAQAGALANHTNNHVGEAAVLYQPPPGKPPPVPPRKPVESTTDILEEYARQQDVTEVIAHCLFQLSCAIRPTGFDKSGEQLDEIHDLFFGQNISHAVPEKETPSAVQFFSIITRVAHEPNDVYAALDTEYDLSVRDDGSQTFLSIAQLPPVFSIALDRVIWDKQANRPAKLNHHVNIPETIFLDRYIESASGSDLMQRRIQTWELKKELAQLTDRRKLLEEKHAQSKDVPGLFEDAKYVLERLQADLPRNGAFGSDLNINPNVISTLGLLAEETKAELESITQRANILNQQIKEAFVDMRKHPYRLHAAFFHRGSAGGGHYWVYIFDHRKEVWRRYNDDRVNIVENRNEIFAQPPQQAGWGNSPPNPYFLVYVRADEIDNLVETVKRDIIYPPPDQPPPIPARNQMTEMPPRFSGFGASIGPIPQNTGHHGINGGELHSQNLTLPPPSYPIYTQDPLVQKEGEWDDSELMTGDARRW